MSSLESEFTSSAEIDALLPGNVMMEVTGYVEAIEPLRELKTFPKWVLTVRLNNGDGKRILVVFRSENALSWSSKLKHNDILQVDGGTIGEVNFKFYKGQEKILNPCDFHVQKDSNVTVLGTYDTRKRRHSAIDIYTDCTIKEVLSANGAVGVTGYLKTDFRTSRTTPEGEHACGVLADDIYILCVEIEDFQKDEKLVRGACVKVVGHIGTTKPGTPILRVQNMKNIYIDKSQPLADRAKLKLAINAPPGSEKNSKLCKRTFDNDNELGKENVSDDKKMKVD